MITSTLERWSVYMQHSDALAASEAQMYLTGRTLEAYLGYLPSVMCSSEPCIPLWQWRVFYTEPKGAKENISPSVVLPPVQQDHAESQEASWVVASRKDCSWQLGPPVPWHTASGWCSSPLPARMSRAAAPVARRKCLRCCIPYVSW